MEMVWEALCNHYLGLGHDIGDPRSDFRGGICDSYDGNGCGM